MANVFGVVYLYLKFSKLLPQMHILTSLNKTLKNLKLIAKMLFIVTIYIELQIYLKLCRSLGNIIINKLVVFYNEA